ncbi:hypothetical protein ABG768_010087 [Culter alburnus]|uniref:Ig-like domain-containing protein n=1 Tax=Culter alburnus TaxID=194366 RepID=A0AAW1ZF75_CULAL
MITIFISLILLLHCSKGCCLLQYVMYWYRQRPGETMRLIVITSAGSDPDFGDIDKDKFEPDKRNAESGSLMVKNLEPEDSAIYFCSVSQHSVSKAGECCTKTFCT